LLSAAVRPNDSGFERKTLPVKSRSTAPKKKIDKPKLVLDSNVFISAVVFGGKPRDILNLAIEGLIEMAISDDALEEIKGVFEGKKFQFPTKIVHALMREIEDLAVFVEPKDRIEAITDDPEDNRVLECAVEAGSNVIISGDSHLLALGSFGKIKIMKPDEFLRRFRKKHA
jgi:putative PIN family toxin of toxin-antitoxin system